MNWDIFNSFTKEIFKIAASGGFLVWLWKKYRDRLINKKLKISKENLTTKNIHSTFRKIYGILWLDMTYLLEPTELEDIDEDAKSHSFTKNGYFNLIEKNNIKRYKFRFFEKLNSDKNITTTVDLDNNKITFELNLRKKDFGKLKDILKEDGYTIQKGG